MAPDPRHLAEAGVSRNANWTPYSEEINDVLMALVPAGCFQMGSGDTESDEMRRVMAEELVRALAGG